MFIARSYSIETKMNLKQTKIGGFGIGSTMGAFMPITTELPAPPRHFIKPGPVPQPAPRAFCVTIGPISNPDQKKVNDFLNAPGKFWVYPKETIGPGDEDYIVHCNDAATPPKGAVEWTPVLVQTPITPLVAVSTGVPVAAPLPEEPKTNIPLLIGIGAAGLLAGYLIFGK
jgi:hypothetical protein